MSQLDGQPERGTLVETNGFLVRNDCRNVKGQSQKSDVMFFLVRSPMGPMGHGPFGRPAERAKLAELAPYEEKHYIGFRTLSLIHI